MCSTYCRHCTRKRIAGTRETSITKRRLEQIANYLNEKGIKARGLARVGLLGTKFTMEQDFYKERLRIKHGLAVLIPEKEERDIIHAILYDELYEDPQVTPILARHETAGAFAALRSSLRCRFSSFFFCFAISF